MAVSVAAGTPCLRRYLVPRAGPVLLYAAEDALHVVRTRLEGIARAAGVRLRALEIQVITAPTVRLDQQQDRERLADTVATLKPRLLILDPFVRLHRVDENVSSEVAPLLAYLRALQRTHDVAVVVVHHAKKGAAKVREGQALRGSSEFHAWGDSNLYVRRSGDRLLLSVEQRAAPSVTGISLALSGSAETLALTAVDGAAPPPPTPRPALPPADERVRHALATAERPVRLTMLRKLCKMRTQTLSTALKNLVEGGHVEKTAAGYKLTP